MTGCEILDSGIAARKNGKRLPCEVLQAENKELREFVLMMLLVCKRYGIVGGVFVQLSSNRNGNCNLEERVDFESRARSLGIEVPE